MRVRKMTRGALSVVGAAALMLTTAGIASAYTTYDSYTLYIPKSNGSDWTWAQKVSVANKKADLISRSVGGGYVVDVRFSGENGAIGGWVRGVGESTRTLDRGGARVGSTGQLEFSSNFTTPVTIKATGSWRAN